MALKILGIETSCDETAAGVVEDGRVLRSNIISSQAELHSRYGGVVPEVASRQHVRDLTPVLDQAVNSCGLGLEDVDAVAVTYGPGLAGALITGLNAAKAIAYALGKPLIGVNHLEAHIYASWLTPANPAEDPGFPLACLVASGGHTDLLLMEGHGDYRLVGRTRDDAAGEAFDKAARILGLGFPGGPEIQRVSGGATGEVSLPRAWMRDTHDFSFSGLKTALLHMAQDRGVYLADSDSPPQDAETAGNHQGACRRVPRIGGGRYFCKADGHGPQVPGQGTCPRGRRHGQRAVAGRNSATFSSSGHHPTTGVVH